MQCPTGSEYVTTLDIAPPDLQKAQRLMTAVMTGASAKDLKALSALDSVASASTGGPSASSARSQPGRMRGSARSSARAFAAPTLSTRFDYA